MHGRVIFGNALRDNAAEELLRRLGPVQHITAQRNMEHSGLFKRSGLFKAQRGDGHVVKPADRALLCNDRFSCSICEGRWRHRMRGAHASLGSMTASSVVTWPSRSRLL